MMKSERIFVALGFCLISVVWGSTWLAIKIGLDSVPPLWGVALRFTFAVLLLAAILLVGRVRVPVDRNAVILYIALGLLSFSLPYALVYVGEQHVSSGLASVVFCMYPFIVALFSHYFLPSERLHGFKIGGIVLGFSGIVYMFWSNVETGSGIGLAMAVILLSAILQAAALIIAKKIGRGIDSSAMNFGGMLAGLVVMYGLALAFEDFRQIHFDGKAIGSILYLGSFGTVVTFVTYYWLAKKIETVYISLSSFITPILAVVLGWLWLHESLPSRVLPGAGLVLAGILVTNGRDLIARARPSSRLVLQRQRDENEET